MVVVEEKEESEETNTWGPTHSEDVDDEEDDSYLGTNTRTDTIFSRDKLDSTLTYLEHKLPFFQCNFPRKAASAMYNLDDDEDATFEDLTFTEFGPKCYKRNGLLRGGFVIDSDDQVPDSILSEPDHLSDVDTLLSDDFSHMEQGIFNEIYDGLCRPRNTPYRNKQRADYPAKKKPIGLCTGGYDYYDARSMSLSFDDGTFDDNTLDDTLGTRSTLLEENRTQPVSDRTLSTVERMRESAKYRAKIAAIVEAQAGRSRVKKEIEARAAALTSVNSRDGNRPLLKTSQSLNESLSLEKSQSLKKSTSLKKSASLKHAGSRLVLHHQIPSDEVEEEQQPLTKVEDQERASVAETVPESSTRITALKKLPSIAEALHKKATSSIKRNDSTTKLSDATSANVSTKSSKSVRKRLMRSLRRLKKKDGKGSSTKGKDSFESNDWRHPHHSETEGVGSVTASVTESDSGPGQNHPDGQEDKGGSVVENGGGNQDRQDETSAKSMEYASPVVKLPSVIEEFEFLPKRREPVYTAYLRSQSNQFVEDVEVLRKESILQHASSDLSTLKQMNSKTRRGFFFSSPTNTEVALDPVQEDASTSYGSKSLPTFCPADQDDGQLDIIDEEFEALEQKQTFDMHQPPLEVDRAAGDDNHTACSSITPSLMTMTSRLAKEKEETELLREMLQKKDQDLEKLRIMLEMNESKFVVERVNSALLAP